MENDKPNDEADRYAALNLAAMHARFGHNEEALNSLNEAIMMAQEANDHMCLQHALMWLFRIQPKKRQFLMQRCISKCNTLGKSALYTGTKVSGSTWGYMGIFDTTYVCIQGSKNDVTFY